MKRCRITVLKTMLFEDLRDTYMPPEFGKMPRHEGGGCVPHQRTVRERQAGAFLRICLAGDSDYGDHAGRGRGVCSAWTPNIACCNDGIRPVILKLESVEA